MKGKGRLFSKYLKEDPMPVLDKSKGVYYVMCTCLVLSLLALYDRDWPAIVLQKYKEDPYILTPKKGKSGQRKANQWMLLSIYILVLLLYCSNPMIPTKEETRVSIYVWS